MFYLYFRAVSDTFRWVEGRGRGGSAGEWQDKEKGAAAGVSAHFPFLCCVVVLLFRCFGYNVMIMALAGRLTFLTKWVALRIIEATKSKARWHETKQRQRWSWSWSRTWTWTRRQRRLMMGSICASLSLQARHAVRVGVEDTVGMAARPECPSREIDAATPNLLCLVLGALCPGLPCPVQPFSVVLYASCAWHFRRHRSALRMIYGQQLKSRTQVPYPTPPHPQSEPADNVKMLCNWQLSRPGTARPARPTIKGKSKQIFVKHIKDAPANPTKQMTWDIPEFHFPRQICNLHPHNVMRHIPHRPRAPCSPCSPYSTTPIGQCRIMRSNAQSWGRH